MHRPGHLPARFALRGRRGRQPGPSPQPSG
jgi:hypothetical protein